jgi:WhiB family redox-sensing transcriptional regulator
VTIATVQDALEWLMDPEAAEPVTLTFADLLHRPAWQKWAACRGADPRWFFPESRGETLKVARGLCSTCRVFDECRAFALADPELSGMWAGMTARERGQLRRRERPPAGTGGQVAS